jgi:hypothetical protein
MKRTLACVLSIPVLAALLAGCSEDNINNILPRGGSIYGRVLDSEEGTTITAWQSNPVSSTQVDADGYFSLDGLDPGLYRIVIQAPSGMHRTFREVSVDWSTNVALGSFRLANLPDPIQDVHPEDGSTGQPASQTQILVVSDEYLDLDSMNERVTIAPPAAGNWTLNYDSGVPPHTYRYVLDGSLALATQYTVTLPPEMELLSGESWGQTLTYSFTTAPFSITDVYWAATRTAVSPSHNGLLVSIVFNAYFNELSARSEVTIEPGAGFDLGTTSQRDRLSIYLSGDLEPGRDYRIIVGADLAAESGEVLGDPDTLTFTVEPFKVTSSYWSVTRTDVPPLRTGSLVTLNFNSPPDLVSAETAVSVNPPIDYDLSGTSGMGLVLNVRGGLEPATEYRIVLDESLESETGARLGETQSVPFTTQPLRVNSLDFGPVESGGSVLPGIDFRATLQMNANIESEALNAAFSFDPAIPGMWYATQASYSGSMIYEFFPQGSVNLVPGQTYTFRLDSSLPRMPLGEDYVTTFTVAPVRVTGVSPSNGSRDVYTYTYISVSFNVPMDQTSTTDAFQLRVLGGAEVSGSLNWNSEGRGTTFHTGGSLLPATNYEIVIAATAKSQSGYTLEEAWSSIFRTRATN